MKTIKAIKAITLCTAVLTGQALALQLSDQFIESAPTAAFAACSNYASAAGLRIKQTQLEAHFHKLTSQLNDYDKGMLAGFGMGASETNIGRLMREHNTTEKQAAKALLIAQCKEQIKQATN